MTQDNQQVKPEELKAALEKAPLIINIPFIHHAKFAELIGVPEGVVGGWIDRAYVPTIKIGRYVFINLVQLQKSSRNADYVGGSIQ